MRPVDIFSLEALALMGLRAESAMVQHGDFS